MKKYSKVSNLNTLKSNAEPLVGPGDSRQIYNCSKCPFVTAYRTSLTRHHRRMHGNKMSSVDVIHQTKHLEKCNYAKQNFNSSKCGELKTDLNNSLSTRRRLMNEPQAQKQNVSSLNHEDEDRNLLHGDMTLEEDVEVMDKEQTDSERCDSNHLLSVAGSVMPTASDTTNKRTSRMVKPAAAVSEHVCTVCGKRCKYARSLAVHVKAHRGVSCVRASEEVDYVSTFSCSKCSFVTSHHTSIVRHVKRMHRKNNISSTDAAMSGGEHGCNNDDGNRSGEVLNTNEQEETTRTTSGDNSSLLNYDSDDDGDDGNTDGTVTQVPTAAESCGASDSAAEGDLELTVDDEEKDKVRESDVTNDKKAGHVCKICRKRSLYSLTLHMMAHNGAFPAGINHVKPDDTRQTFNCSVCPFKTLFRTSLTRHNRRMHGNIAADGRTSLRRKRARQEFECSKCQFKTSSHSSLMKHDRHLHMSDMHQNVKDVKEQSGSQSKHKMRNKDSASGHMTAKCNDARPTYNCSICLYSTPFHTSLTRHNREMHGNMLVDSVNSTQCNSRSDDDDGNIGGTETRVSIAADPCVASDSIRGVESEQTSHSETSEKKWHTPCSRNRVKPDDKRQTFNCDICLFKTLFRTSLSRHKRLMHATAIDSSENSPKCNNSSDHNDDDDDGNNGNIGSTESNVPIAAVSGSQHGKNEDDGNRIREVLSNDDDAEIKWWIAHGQEQTTIACGYNGSQLNNSNDNHADGDDDSIGGAETQISIATVLCW